MTDIPMLAKGGFITDPKLAAELAAGHICRYGWDMYKLKLSAEMLKAQQEVFGPPSEEVKAEAKEMVAEMKAKATLQQGGVVYRSTLTSGDNGQPEAVISIPEGFRRILMNSGQLAILIINIGQKHALKADNHMTFEDCVIEATDLIDKFMEDTN